MTETEHVLIGDIVVQIVRSARRKRLTLEVAPDGVKARAPARMRQQSIAEFVLTKEHWIKRCLSNLPAPVSKLELVDGAKIMILGEPYSLTLIPESRGKVHYNEKELIVPVMQSHLPIEKTVQRKLIQWFKALAQQEIQQRIPPYAQNMAVPEHKTLAITVRDYKRRWGSCDHLGHLSFNWRIIQAPPAIMDYVIIHELAHCHELNHSKRFWRHVAQQMPDWQEQQQWLHQYGAQLYRF